MLNASESTHGKRLGVVGGVALHFENQFHPSYFACMVVEVADTLRGSLWAFRLLIFMLGGRCLYPLGNLVDPNSPLYGVCIIYGEEKLTEWTLTT